MGEPIPVQMEKLEDSQPGVVMVQTRCAPNVIRAVAGRAFRAGYYLYPSPAGRSITPKGKDTKGGCHDGDKTKMEDAELLAVEADGLYLLNLRSLEQHREKARTDNHGNS